MNSSIVILIATIIILSIALVFSAIFPYFLTGEEREGVRPRDGITVVHSNHIDIDTNFFFVTTRDPNLIEFRFVSHPNTNDEKPGMIGIYFPYKVKLDKEYNTKYTDYTNWYEEDYEHGTTFVRKFPCDNDSCNLFQSNQVRFILESGLKFDSKVMYKHSIKIKFQNSGGKALDVFGKFEDSRNLDYNLSNDTREATIIIPERAERIYALPIPDPGIFHNTANDYSNTQLDWKLTKNAHAFFVDYDISTERIDFEKNQYEISVLGIIVGVPLGILAIVISIIYGKLGREKNTSFSAKYKIYR